MSGPMLPMGVQTILDEIAAVFTRMPADALDPVVAAIAGCPRVLLYGQGRAGLVMRGLAMRLFHLGLDAHAVGDMTTPPLRAGDLFLLNASRGDLATGLALIDTARRAGGRVAVIAGVADGPAIRAADIVLHIPAQTKDATDDAPASCLPMGSQYELALAIAADLIVLALARRRGIDIMEMAKRHTNLL